MAYAMFCDHCKKVIKENENVVAPFSVLELVGPSMKSPIKFRYCEDCAKELIAEAEKTRKEITEELGNVGKD